MSSWQAERTSANANDEVVFTGMEVVRRDWTDLAHRIQRELYERLFRDRDLEGWLKDDRPVEAVETTVSEVDPKLDQEFKPQQRFGPNGETEEEYLKEQGGVLETLAKTQQMMAELIGQNQVAVPVESAPAEPEAVPLEAAPAAAESPDKEQAPCGKAVTKGYMKQHERFCKEPQCVKGDDAA